MRKILISACLAGERVRYDGKTLAVATDIMNRWFTQGQVISVCPEAGGGMSVPRAPAEIMNGDGLDVQAGKAQVVDNMGIEVTGYFMRGAQLALSLCQKHQIQVAVLAEASPSCGSSIIHDGSFSGKKIAGVGVTTALLRANGIEVFSQHEIAAADQALQRFPRFPEIRK
jgi:uncharacterized protein YbbK (DUF523 family)